MKPFPAKLCAAMVALGYRADAGVVTLQCAAETFPYLITWPDGQCLKVRPNNIEKES